MTRQADPLKYINVTSPCSYDWDSMTGNEQVRFCGHCHLSVHHLSEMRPKEVLRLVIRSRGRLCVRYRRRPESSVQTASLPARLHQIKRRATRIAAGAFTAALSLSSTAAAARTASSSQALHLSVVEITAFNQLTRSQSLHAPGSTLAGHILDPQGAAVPGSRVTLTNEQTGIEQIIFSNDEGAYRFEMLEAGTYTLKFEQAGFKTTVIEGIALNGDNVQPLDASLEIGGLDENPSVMGSAAMAEPSVPLVKAAIDNDMAALKELLEAGANVDATDEIYHASALAMAVDSDNLEMVQSLLWAGADVNARNSLGQTALMYLNERSTSEVAEALVAAGAKLDLQDEDGDTALITVAAYNNGEILQVLLDAGAAVNMKNNKGETALIVAANEGIVENVKALIMAGADVYERDAEGKTALTHAREHNNTRAVKLLRTYGAVEYLQ